MILLAVHVANAKDRGQTDISWVGHEIKSENAGSKLLSSCDER